MKYLLIVVGFLILLAIAQRGSEIENRDLQIWQVRCDSGIIEYIAPERISLEQEIKLCEE